VQNENTHDKSCDIENTAYKIDIIFKFIKLVRNVCLVLILQLGIIGLKVWIGGYDIKQMHIFDMIVHYAYFISVLGYLFLTLRIVFLYEIDYKKKIMDIGKAKQQPCNYDEILVNICGLVVCVIVAIIVTRCEREINTIDWLILQYGLLAWIISICVVEKVTSYLNGKGVKGALEKGGRKIAHDTSYIPKLLERLEDSQLKQYIAHELYTYAARARFYKIGYYICSIVALTAPAIAMMLNSAFEETVIGKCGISVFSGMATIASGLLGIVKFKESWIRYRYNCEILKREIVSYVNDADEYKDSDNKKQVFYKRIDQIIYMEIGDWKQLRQKEEN